MTLAEAQEHVFECDVQFLGLLAEMRMAVYRSTLATRLPCETLKQAQSAQNAEKRTEIASLAVRTRLYSLLYADIDDIIDREEAEAKQAAKEAREARGEALGTDH